VLPFAVLAWESDLNVRLAIEQRYVTNFASQQFLTGATASFGARTVGPSATYELSLSGSSFGAYSLPSGAGGSISPLQIAGRLGGGATWQTSPHSELTLQSQGTLASELGASPDDDPATFDAFAGNRVQYATAHDLGLRAGVSRRTSLSVGAGYGQTGTLMDAGSETPEIDTHVVRNRFGTSYEASPIDRLSAELGLRYTRYERAIIDVQQNHGGVNSYAGTLVLNEAHDFSRNLRGGVGGGLTWASWVRTGWVEGSAQEEAPSGSGLYPEGRADMAYTGPNYRTSWGYALSFTSLGPRIGDGQSHAAWLRASVLPLRGRLLRDFTIQSSARLSYGITPLKEQADAGDARVWSALTAFDTACPITPAIALTGGLRLELRHTALDPAPPQNAVTWTSVRLTAIVGISGVLSAHPAANPAAEQPAARD
jgi:hypothetical protein